jgi:hypothetical protein
MHDSFDPYERWLSIPPAEQPPNHYRLLGLRLFENDRVIITRAVELRVGHLRACNDGVHRARMEELLGKVDAAGRTLLNPVLKQQYDNLLHRRGLQPTDPAWVARQPALTEGEQPASEAPAPPERASGPSDQTDAGPSIVAEAKHRKYAGRKGFPWTIVFSCAFGALISAAVILAVLYFSRNGSDKLGPPAVAESRQPISRSDTGAEPSAPGLKPSDPRPRTRWDTVKGPLGPATMVDLVEEHGGAPPDAGTVSGALAAARRAMAARDLTTARARVDAARAAATSSTEQAEVERVGKLLDLVETFWQAARGQWAQLVAGQEFEISGSGVIVVDNREGELTVRAAGQNRSYTVEDAPWKLAVALAQKRLPGDKARKNLHIGAFLAIDGLGDRAEARRRWEIAGETAAELLAELDHAPPVSAARSRQPPPRARVGSPVLPGAEIAPAASPSSSPVEKLAVPDAQARAKSEREIRELFRDEFRGARLPANKSALCNKLIGLAAETTGDPAGRFVLCELARDLAVEAGDAPGIIAAIEEMGRHYGIDKLASKADAISQAWRSAATGPQRAALYQHAQNVLQATLDAEHYAAADVIVRTALSGARSMRDFARVRELEATEREIRAALGGR